MDTNASGRRGRPRRFPKPDQIADAGSDMDMPDAAVEQEEAPAAPSRSLRPPMRKEYNLASAQERAAEIFGHVGTVDEGVDDFYIDRSRIPPGWDMEWKTKTVLGAEDPAQMVGYIRMGWESVPLHMFPEMMPVGWRGNTIERKGMLLMMRPKQVTDMVRATDAKRARDAIRAKEQQLSSAPDGQFTRDHAQAKPKIGKSYEPMPIPQD